MAKSRRESPAAKLALTIKQIRTLDYGTVLRLHIEYLICDVIFVGATETHVRLKVALAADAPTLFQGFYDYYATWTLFDLGLEPDEKGEWSRNYVTIRDAELNLWSWDYETGRWTR
jgi:hypothetical protein